MYIVQAVLAKHTNSPADTQKQTHTASVTKDKERSSKGNQTVSSSFIFCIDSITYAYLFIKQQFSYNVHVYEFGIAIDSFGVSMAVTVAVVMGVISVAAVAAAAANAAS